MSEEKLPAGWARTTLEPLGKLYCGQSLTASKVNRDGRGVPYVTGPEQWDGEKVHQDKWTTEPARMAPDGCIFITVKGAGVGKLFPGIACAIGRDVYAYHPSPELPRKFIELSLRFTIAEVVAEAKGDIPGLSKNHILDHSIPLPPLAEQKRIVAKIEELFSELDAGEESLRRARRQLGVYRQSLLKQAFEGKLTAPWRAQHPDLLESPDQLLARIQAERQARYQQQLKEWEKAVKESEKLGDSAKKPTKPKLITPPQKQPDSKGLPDEWTWVDLGLLKQFSLYGPRFSSDDYSEDGVCVLRTSDIGESGKVNLATAPRLSLNAVELYQYGCQKGDILITRTGSLGTLAVFNDDVDSIPGAYLIQYRLVAAHYSPFLYHFLRGPVGQSALTGGGAGVGRPNLNAPTIEAIPIPLCSLPEQQEIVRLLDGQFEVIEQNEREIDAALKRSEALRQSILKKAFTGQLVPQDPTDEPASELLSRIRTEREKAERLAKEDKKVAKKKAARQRPSESKSTMQNLMEVLKKNRKWISAQEAFEQLGIRHGSGNDEVEAVYNQLRAHIAEIDIKRRGDEDWLRLKGGKNANR